MFPAIKLRIALPQCRSNRSLSTTCIRRTHYETLGLPENASKSQIKSHFYKLSKQHHPDVSKDPESEVVFRKASEAYAVLSNDRERRAYDRSLLHRSSTTSQHPYHPRTPAARAARATHAWETRPKGPFKRPPPDYDFRPKSSSHARKDQPYGSPFNHPVQEDVLRGTRQRMEESDREMDKIRNELPFLRTFQLLSAVFVSFVLFKGISSR
ncbi:DnaJ-domain-containing protein [Pholiota conissans]|uniref:DnaJ-domain-containing protein n=1 Tax=Pholiota conissans TaxID=109636 RepID=A0A9P5YUC3_9AGAR|nr:DnaJ-domain-containing protein [Pholiota conissans]